MTAALAIIARKGADGLTMRDLASDLGVSPMAAYHYVESKDDLLRRVGDHIWGALEVPPPEAGSWPVRLRTAVLAERDALALYPGLDLALMYLDVERRREFEDASLDLLLDAGVAPAKAVMAFRTLMSWVVGHRLIDTILRDPQRRRPPARRGKAARISIDRGQVPEMRADDYFAFGLDVVIDGLQEMLAD